MPLSTSERTLASRAGAHQSWANTPNRTARTAPARAAAMQRFEDQVDPDRSLAPAERAKRAESARRAYFADLARRSARARRLRREADAELTTVTAEAEAAGFAAGFVLHDEVQE